MKKITQGRILRALEKNFEYFHNHPDQKIIQILSRIGFKFSDYTFFNNYEVINERIEITERQKLELSYYGFYDQNEILKRLSKCRISKTGQIEDIWFQSWYWLTEKKRQREQKILDIQYKYKISGLEEEKLFVDGEIIESYRPHALLRLIEEDYTILKDQRLKALEIFLKTIKIYEMPVYELKTDVTGNESWILTTSELVSSLVQNYDWADVWENKYYVNANELSNELLIIDLEKQKNQSQSDLDRFVWDLYLYTGNGDPDESEDSSFFCARII